MFLRASENRDFLVGRARDHRGTPRASVTESTPTRLAGAKEDWN